RSFRQKFLRLSVILPILGIIAGIAVYGAWIARSHTPQGYFASGKKLFDQKKYDQATIQLLNSVRQDPHNRDALYYLALSYEQQSQLTAAVKAFRTLLESHPDDIPANLELGEIALKVAAR